MSNKSGPDYRSMVVEFIACMYPSEREHPTMYAAWVKGQALLESDPCDPSNACSTHGRCWKHSEWELLE